MRGVAFTLAFMGGSALAATQNYDVVCAVPCVAEDGTTQPPGTALRRVMWDGKTAFAPQDSVQDPKSVKLVADPNAQVKLYVPQGGQPPADGEYDCTPTEGGKCVLPLGTGLSVWTLTEPLNEFTLVLPPNPVTGPRSRLQVVDMSGYPIKHLSVYPFGQKRLGDISLDGPKAYWAINTPRGWALLP